ncbi:MAG TPA: hydrogenase 4 subunit B, partial [Xanthobacteraceae bacterium]
MAVLVGLGCVAAFFIVSALSLVRGPFGTAFVYAACGVIALVAFMAGATQLLDGTTSTVILPLGLAVLGGHFRIDALSAFFLTVIDLGGAVTSLYALGYGRHEDPPMRVLPYYPAFLAAMNLVLMADDAFAFLLSWEFMSLASWAMVLAHHRDPANARAGY